MKTFLGYTTFIQGEHFAFAGSPTVTRDRLYLRAGALLKLNVIGPATFTARAHYRNTIENEFRLHRPRLTLRRVYAVEGARR